MVPNKSNLLAVSTILTLLLMPMFFYIVSFKLDSQINDEALLKRLTFINGSIQRVIKLTDHTQGLIADINDAFISSEAEQRLSIDFLAFKSCWQEIRQALKTAPNSVKKHSEVCWVQGNKTIFDLHYVMEMRRKSMLDDLYMLGAFGTLLLLYLLYLIFKHVHFGLEKNQLIDPDTGIYNVNAFLQECGINAITAKRRGFPFTVLLIKFPKQKSRRTHKSIIVKKLKQVCRKEEKLFILSRTSFALMTLHTKLEETLPLLKRLHANLSEVQSDFTIEPLEYSSTMGAEEFGPACLQKLEDTSS